MSASDSRFAGRTLGLLLCGFLATLALLLGGCATPALWEEARFARYHEPADRPNLRLFKSNHGSDILVEYDETREGSDSILRRAYLLEPNVERLRDRRKPEFVPAEESHGLEAIPVFEPHGPLVPPAGQACCAVVSTNGRTFTIYSLDKNME